MTNKRWNQPTPANRPSRITVPKHAHPVARFYFEQMNAQRITYQEMSMCSGVLVCTIKATRNENTPGINTSDAILGVLGYTLLPVPLPETLSADLRADLEALAEKYDLRRDLRTDLIAACVGREPYTARSWRRRQEMDRRKAALAA